jgi:chromosome segregation ATPase
MDEQKLDKVHEDLTMAKRELELGKRAVTRLEKRTFRLMRNDKWLKRKMENTNRLLLSGQAELKNFRVCIAEQQLDTRELAKATRELESKNKTISELEVKTLSLDENDSQLKRIEEPGTPVIEIPEIETACLASSRANENNLFVLDKERLENELSLLQSQLTDSSSKLQQYQNVQDELATTKNELEEKKREITDIAGENFHLTKENSGLMRKIEARDRLIAYKRTKLEQLHNCYEEKKLHKVHNELASSQRALVSKNRAIIKLQEQNQESRAELEKLRTCLSEQQLDTSQLTVATRELESKSRTISELEANNLRLSENDSQLRRKIEETDRLLLSSKAEMEEVRVSLSNQTDTIEQLLDQVKSLEKEKDEALQKLAEMENNQKEMKPKLTVDVGCSTDEEVFNQLQIEETIIPPVTEITEILTSFLTCNSTAVQAKSTVAEPQPLATDAMENTPARTFNEKKAVKQCTKQQQAALPEFSITTTIEKEVYVDRIVVTGIANKDCGRVIGHHGSNAKRIENEYWVSVNFINGNLFITGGDAESRLAACSDVIDNLPVTIECPTIKTSFPRIIC